jgi:dTDP-4-amino-4,6-dideoxygalactose transaminase
MSLSTAVNVVDFAPPDPGEREIAKVVASVRAALWDRGVTTSVHFSSFHLQAYYAQRWGYRRGMFPVAESISDRSLSLPLSSGMTDDAVDRVIEALHEVTG